MTHRWRGFILSCTAVFVLAWAGLVVAQNSPGGAFLTNFDYILDTPNGWLWRTLTPWRIEGIDDASETTITFTEPTADRTHTHQNASGTVVLGEAASSGGVASGTITLDGANPTSVTTGLTTLLGCDVSALRTTMAGVHAGSLHLLTIQTTATAGQIDIYAWTATSSSNPTLIASTSRDVVTWFCNGTQ